MLIKLGVYLDKLGYPIRRQLKDIDRIYRELTGAEAVITSTNEGNHSPRSLHYANLAVDLRSPGGKRIRGAVVDALKTALGAGFDVIDETDHIHVAFDPKG